MSVVWWMNVQSVWLRCDEGDNVMGFGVELRCHGVGELFNLRKLNGNLRQIEIE